MVNIISQIVLSHQLFQSKELKTNSFKEMIVESMVWAEQFNIGDFIPFIAWMDIQGILRQMKCVHKKFNKFLTELIEEHQASSDEQKPSIFQRAHEEMGQEIGRSHQLKEFDSPKLPYLRAICKESFRLHPSTPLNLPVLQLIPFGLGRRICSSNKMGMMEIEYILATLLNMDEAFSLRSEGCSTFGYGDSRLELSAYVA
ncbi:hypothetical protein AAG906_006028 [Vitis piasezkii]